MDSRTTKRKHERRMTNNTTKKQANRTKQTTEMTNRTWTRTNQRKTTARRSEEHHDHDTWNRIEQLGKTTGGNSENSARPKRQYVNLTEKTNEVRWEPNGKTEKPEKSEDPTHSDGKGGHETTKNAPDHETKCRKIHLAQGNHGRRSRREAGRKNRKRRRSLRKGRRRKNKKHEQSRL